MFSADKISFSVGDRVVLDRVSFTMNPGDRAGLSGLNGAGKTTLLKIMAGRVEPDSGRFIAPGDSSTGYLPQEVVAGDLAKTVWDEAHAAFSGLMERKAGLDRLRERLELMDARVDPAGFDRLVQQEAELSGTLEQAGLYELDARTGAVLAGLGFDESAFHRPLSEFSGGWIMRARLAAILLASPDLLLLDEPTNHLDLSSVMWLENWLSEYRGAVVLVSHDQTFMDRVVNRIFELDRGRLATWKGDLSSWLVQKEKMRLQEEARARNINLRLGELDRFIRRFRSKATKARQVQNRIKEYERLKAELPESGGGGGRIHFSFPEPERCGRVVVAGYSVSRKFDNYLFRDVDFMVSRGDRIALVGDNGVGKSTLARIIAGEERAFEGEMEYGHNVKCSWFAQHQAAALDPDQTVLEVVAGNHGDVKRARDVCGAFLFSGDDVDKKISTLSGGEKSRAALARILFSPGNFLILDEPTNHLDIISRQMLKRAIQSFRGTVLIVSHDRFFLDGLANRVWHMENGELEQFPGGLGDYLEVLKGRERGACQAEVMRSDRQEYARAAAGEGKLSNRDRRRLAAAERERFRKAAGPVQEEISGYESRIEELEEKRSGLEALLADPDIYNDPDRAREINVEYAESGKALDELYEAWEDASSRLEKIRAELAVQAP